MKHNCPECNSAASPDLLAHCGCERWECDDWMCAYQFWVACDREDHS